MTIANKDDKIISLRAEFGMWGIGVYWTIVEMVAEQIEENSDRAKVNLIVSELLGFFGCKRNKLETFLKHSANVQLMDYEIKDNILEIDIPKLLDFADNYIKYNGKSLKTIQRQNKMSLKQEENKNRIEESMYPFDEIWNKYPKRLGKKQAEKHFKASIKTDKDWANINKALTNYLQSDLVKKDGGKFIQHGSTWFNNWRDWCEIEKKDTFDDQWAKATGVKNDKA